MVINKTIICWVSAIQNCLISRITHQSYPISNFEMLYPLKSEGVQVKCGMIFCPLYSLYHIVKVDDLGSKWTVPRGGSGRTTIPAQITVHCSSTWAAQDRPLPRDRPLWPIIIGWSPSSLDLTPQYYISSHTSE